MYSGRPSIDGGQRAIVIAPAEAARNAITRVLDRLAIETVLEAPSLAAAVEGLGGKQAELVVVGQRLVDAADVLACRAVRDALPASRLMTLTWYASDREWLVALMAGASACLLWQVGNTIDQIAEIAIRVLAGENLIAEERAGAMTELAQPHSALTPPEAAIALMLARSDTDTAIADALDMPGEEVRAHITAIVQKLAPSQRLY